MPGPRHVKFMNHIYRRAATLSPEQQQAFDTLVQMWLDDGHQKLFEQSFAHLPAEDLAEKMADKFSVYIGALAEDLPWHEHAQKIKGKKEQ